MSAPTHIALLFLPALFLACGPVEERNVSRRYTDAVRRLDISPVYPPREEFQVGDLYFVSQSRTDPDDVMRILIKTLPEVRLQAQRALDDRIVFRDTGFDQKEGKPVTDEVSFIQSDLTGGKLKTRREVVGTESLPIATFPSIEADAGTTLNNSIVSPLVALGLFAGSRTKLRLDFKDVRTLSAPYLEANSVLQREAGARQKAHCPEAKIDFAAKMAQNFLRSDDKDLKAKLLARDNYYVLITRAYLTRHIDYTYSNGRILALARRSLAGQSADGKAPSFFQGANIAISDPSGKSATADLAAIVAALNQQSSQESGTQFATFSAFGLTIKRVFQKPLTIAYEGTRADIDYVKLSENDPETDPAFLATCGAILPVAGQILRTGTAGVMNNPGNVSQ